MKKPLLIAVIILITGFQYSHARVFTPPEELPPFVDEEDPIQPPLGKPAPVEIIDGGDVDTLKALYPGVCEDDCPGLRRMREQRLQAEARCEMSDEHEFVDFVSLTVHDSADEALKAIEIAKNAFEVCRKEMPEGASPLNLVNESVYPTPVQGATSYNASLAANVRVLKGSVQPTILIEQGACQNIHTISLREEQVCP